MVSRGGAGESVSTPRRSLISWQLWHQVSDALSLSAVTLIIDDLHLLERQHGSWLLRDALRRAGGKPTPGHRYPE